MDLARQPLRRTRITNLEVPETKCIGCHMPKIEQTIADVNVRAHTFKFITPATTDTLKVPNACTECHTDKTTAWANDAPTTWAKCFTVARRGRVTLLRVAGNFRTIEPAERDGIERIN
jgi:hypothetical protein